MILRIVTCIKKNIIRTYTHDVYKKQENLNMWTSPSATEMRFGFEVTMYVMNK
jgi:pyrroloquinoline quinone biosynthesis protein A